MTTYRYWALQCDACDKTMGRTSDGNYDGRGITICAECWSQPMALPSHLKSTISLDQVRLGRQSNRLSERGKHGK